MQKDRNNSLQQMRENLREVEERLEQWQVNYAEYLYQLEKLRLRQDYFRRLIHLQQAGEQKNNLPLD